MCIFDHSVSAGKQAPAWARGLLILTGAVLLMSCSVLPDRQPRTPTTNYVLEWQPGEKLDPSSAKPPPCGAMLVGMPRAAPGLDTARMAYVQRHYRLDYFAHHQWADTPARMLAPLLVRSLAGSGLFTAVVAATTPVNAELRLESEILALQQVFSGKHSAVRISTRINIIDASRQDILLSRIFTATEPAASDDPYSGVVAANRAVGRLLGELVQNLRRGLDDGSLVCGPRHAAPHPPG